MLRLGVLLLVLWSQASQDVEKPLPDQASFLAGLRKTVRSDDKLLSQYTYTETEKEISLDSKGQAKKTEVNVYQVTNGAEEWQTYRRRISKNGVPLTQQELDKQDREERERVAKEIRKRANQSEEKRRQEKAKSDREEEEAINDVFSMFEFKLLRRETLDDVSTIVVSFKPKPKYKPKKMEAKMLQHLAGQLWVAEDDHELAKIDAEVVEPISIGAGLLAKLQKGSKLMFQRRKINGEAWLPVKEDVTINGKLFLLKGINIHEIVEYSDHQKYNVDTILKFGGAVP